MVCFETVMQKLPAVFLASVQILSALHWICFRLGDIGLTGFYLGIFVTAVLISLVLTRYVRDFALVRGWVSVPLSDRHVHSRALPRLGGVAIFFAFLSGLVVASVLGWLDS